MTISENNILISSANVLIERQIEGFLENENNVELIAKSNGEEYSGKCFPSSFR